MPIDYPPDFDQERGFVRTYVRADGVIVAHGSTVELPPLPPGAVELSPQEYDDALTTWKADADAHLQAQLDREQAAALVHFQALILLIPEATARLLTGYAGPWPVRS